MPKQLYKIIAFHGGLATGPDPRDILDGQLSEAIDIMVDSVGTIRTLGSSVVHKATANVKTGFTGTLEAGYGLFYFSHDYTGAEDGGASEAITGDNYLALWDDADGEAWIYSEAIDDGGATGWDDDTNNAENAPIIVGTGTPVFHIADGSLRVADATFTRTTKWYGYIKRTLWPDASGNAQAIDGWYATDNTIAGPVHSGTDLTRVGQDDAWPVIVTDLYAPTIYDDHLGMAVLANKRDSGGWTGYINYYSTVIYDNNQESLPARFNNSDPDDNIYQNATKRFWVYYDTGGGDIRNKRETGARIYWREVDSAYKPYGDLYLLFEVDHIHGVRKNVADEWTGWVINDHEYSSGNTNTDLVRTANYLELNSKPRTEAYGARSGYLPNLHSISAKYKTSVVANRRCYIGNVQFTDEGGTVVTKGDAVIKSPVNSFDVFPVTNILEATVNDGDEIVKLEVYADRLLQFKKHKLEIINISQAVEFLEETFHHKGVGHQAAVCKTDFGIAWVNKFGCYLFDGQKVNDLLEKGGIQIIKESDWDTFTNDPVTKQPMIGYVPNKRQLIVVDDISTNGDGSIYLYDMVTKSWVKGAAGTIQDEVKTNFVNDWDGNLVWVHTNNTSTPAQWSDTSVTTSTISFKTKDIDFGQPGQKKNIYKVYVSYKGDGTAVTINYATNGDNDTYSGQFYRCNANGSSTGATASNVPLHQASVGVDDWISAELKPTASISNIYSFQLLFDGDTTDANFQINDISIVYRLKGVR
jgi:hypothetical protein